MYNLLMKVATAVAILSPSMEVAVKIACLVGNLVFKSKK